MIDEVIFPKTIIEMKADHIHFIENGRCKTCLETRDEILKRATSTQERET